SALASRVFIQDHVVEAKISNDGHGLLIRTRNAEEFYKLLNHVAAEGVVEIETVAPADEDVNSIYQYLIGSSADGGTA
ncbi:MAG TPA: hypothetical protein VKB56_04280, partial [Terriglobales bacterium]|nr:hypothetical protein [Terriglobales bacterium]